jgi:RNA polymerase sigma-70 factor (ECF subfamily)
MTCTSEELKSVFALTAEPKSLGVFGEGDLNDPLHYTDEELVAAAQSGFSPALGMLLTRHRRILYATVRRMTANAEEAEDVVQDAMLRVCVSIGTFRREARFSSWLITIATNSLLSSRRRLRPTQWIYLDDTEALSHQRSSYALRDPSPTPEQECAARELLYQAQSEMRKLHRSYREVLATRDIDQESIGNSARDLGISVATFKTRLRRGRSQLSQALGRMRVTRSANEGARRKSP